MKIGYCELCGGLRDLDKHHEVPKARGFSIAKRYICRECHGDVHNLANERFFKKYGRNRSEFIKVKNDIDNSGRIVYNQDNRVNYENKIQK